MPSEPSTSPNTEAPASTPSPTEIQAAARARVESQLTASALGTKKKRKATDDRDDDEPITLRWYGRNFVRNGCGPYERIHPIIEFGVKLELIDPEDRPANPSAEDVRLAESWEILKALIPNFADDMVELGGDVKTRKHVASQGGANGARGDDTGSFKGAAIDWALPLPPPALPGEDPPPPEVISPPIPKAGKKVYLGQNHPVTARALRPISFPDTQETYDKIKAGDEHFKILGRQLPTFMFTHSQVYDKEDVEAGYLEGHMMRAAARHVYLGPSAALTGPDSSAGKAGNAAINGVRALTGRDITYLACQLRFALSSVESWHTMDGDFSYREFYWKVVDSLRGDEGQAHLDRFNRDIFGTGAAAKQSAAATAHIPDEFELLQQQRAAKRARAAEAAAAA
ncbi:hypothetical protein MVEN_00684100 [Mycena venus]|uniref:Uncharacterized protein n=1 Tax=Mycena venus TaxID=2733690 RepID=A0A8H6YH14_9AGAR|nr:hypothetical protein MVEN_00684100 [Mycena venus]